VVATLSGTMAAGATKNAKVGVSTGTQAYIACKVGSNL
jgi:hypothetical protein